MTLRGSQVLFFGGNGHDPVRLDRARQVAQEAGGPQLVAVRYPGFEGRPAAADLEAFLEAVAEDVDQLQARRPAVALYATGIGALLLLALRAQGRARCPRVILQGPVLWGVGDRWLPTLVRAPLLRAAARRLVRASAFLEGVMTRVMTRPLRTWERRGLARGYRRCPAFADLFAWIHPAWLEQLARDLARRPEALDGVEVWWGDLDPVVGPAEQRAAEGRLGVRFPARHFPTWGHYPMIEDPEGWVDALRYSLQAKVSARLAASSRA